MSDDNRQAQEEKPSKRAPTILIIGTIIMSLLLTGSAVIIFVGYSQQQSDRRWCALLSSLDQPDVPVTTERGRQVQQQIRQLRRDFHCGLGKSTLGP